jgi:hypothetical protein
MMKTETRTFDDVVLVTKVTRYTPAEKIGLVAGDCILSFGAHPPHAIIADNDLLGSLKRSDLLFVMRGKTAFKLGYGEGIEGATFEAGRPLEDVTVATGVNWPHYWGGMQTTGELILVPDHISPIWAIFPPLLYARFHNWQMLAATSLVWCVGLIEGPVTIAMAYLVSVAAALFGGASMMREASERQGYVPRGSYMIARGSDAAALEIITAERIRRIRSGLPPVLPSDEQTDQAAEAAA